MTATRNANNVPEVGFERMRNRYAVVIYALLGAKYLSYSQHQ